ncbi:serine/threonine protein kinase [Streptomyces ipomoeae]|uniref:Serine/threonine protein kinase n=3 Tax=Streptomyces ipomoeae TaxID=103232 RepID=A0AAE8VTT6_9ACTN|nr:protein kinase [Streptomyces ipomoeae]TQE16651.1 serine/threonine protein kinase [Streptomyces ipomoeae]TQE24097.1 serine/threonine protein kinase [Streptomyces ipomoeae]
MSDQRPEPPPYSPASGDAALKQTGATPLRANDPGRLGPYVPLGLLGSGGMGRVYLARPGDDVPGLAAVKVIRPEYAEDTEFRRRFQREARVHERVRTPYAPRLLGTGFEDGDGSELLWMATQYLPGLNLADAVRDCGTLPAAGAWRLVGELGRALSALAAAGVVHRDLKPSNVLLSAEGVHVIDFGISQAVDSSAITTTGSRVGTPAYMSPEYLRDGRCDSASDVFSLAGTLVYAVTGHAPFGDGTGVDVMHRVAFEEPKPEVMADLTATDPALADLLSACLTKDPAGRPTPARLVEAAATAAGTHGPGLPWPAPLDSRLVSRRQACELLANATARQTGHFRVPTERVKAPTTTPGFGPATPAGAQGAPGAHTPPGGQGAQGAQTPPGAYGAATPPGSQTPPGAYGPPVPVGAYGMAPGAGAQAAAAGVPATATSTSAKRRRRKPYFAVVAALAVCAVAASTYLVTRSAADDTAAPTPTAGTTSAPDGEAASPLPGSSASPSSSPGKDKKEKGDEKAKESPSPDPTRETPDPTPTDADDPASGGSSGGDDDGDTATKPTPTPTKTATKPATPPWISQCTYYSGTELTDRGDEGKRVVQVQCMLEQRGYSVGGSGVDGKFGRDTEAAVRRFQTAKGLDVDGQVGVNTWAALRSST